MPAIWKGASTIVFGVCAQENVRLRERGQAFVSLTYLAKVRSSGRCLNSAEPAIVIE